MSLKVIKMGQKTIPVSAQSLFECDVNEKGSLNKCFCCLQTGYQDFLKSITVNEKRGVDVLPAMDALPHSTLWDVRSIEID